MIDIEAIRKRNEAAGIVDITELCDEVERLRSLIPPEGAKVLVPKDDSLPFVQGDEYWLGHGACSTRSLVENRGRLAWVEWNPLIEEARP